MKLLGALKMAQLFSAGFMAQKQFKSCRDERTVLSSLPGLLTRVGRFSQP
jgi:hypothetical protein